MCIQIGELPLALTVEQAAKLLNISRNLAYDLVRQGVIPSLRLGRIMEVSFQVPRPVGGWRARHPAPAHLVVVLPGMGVAF